QALDAEITFKSSDGILFHIHKANLVACSESFTPPENSTFDEIVPLTEDSATLELLFQFIYPQPNPDLDQLKFEELALLAEAAEKYRVFPAMNLCAIFMEHPDHLKAHAEEILQHALKHNIRTLASRAAPLLLNRPLDDFVQVLPPHFVVSWFLLTPQCVTLAQVRYYTCWKRVSDLAIKHVATLNGTSPYACRTCGQLPHEKVLNAASSICQDLVALQDLSAAISIPPCCPDGISKLVAQLEASSVSIPAFADFALPDKDLHESLNQVPDDDQVMEATPNDESKITYVSRDLVSFALATENIKTWSTNLPNVLRLTETSSTLEALFQFLQNAPHPDLDGFDFDFLGPLSLAAEHYRVFPAISVCKIQREGDLDKHPMAVMHYALGSRNYELMDKAAPLLLLESPVRIVRMIDNTDASACWFKWVEEWNKALRIASAAEKRRTRTLTHYSQSRRLCGGCDDYNPDSPTIMVLKKLNDGVKSLLDLNDTFIISTKFCCPTSCADIQMWRNAVESAIQSIPSFSSIVQQSLLATVE
ncbi:hypothetical protein H0H93_008883, partial [Arthromyces matolae]